MYFDIKKDKNNYQRISTKTNKSGIIRKRRQKLEKFWTPKKSYPQEKKLQAKQWLNYRKFWCFGVQNFQKVLPVTKGVLPFKNRSTLVFTYF